jgi:hypothetical protein
LLPAGLPLTIEKDRRPLPDNRSAGCALLFLCALLFATPARALPGPELLPAALAAVPGAELVFFDEPRPGQPTQVLVAAVTRAPVARVRALLLDPAAYRRAVPSFRRADPVSGRPGEAQQVEWELEVPLWNLEGKLWLRPVPDGVDLQLAEGDMAPGYFQLRARPTAGGVLLSVAGHANMGEANWATRRLVKRSPLAEPAMTATAAWVLLHALVLEAERPGTGVDPRRWPSGPLAPPDGLDGSALGRLARQRLPAGQAVAAVHSKASGRLERVEVAVTARFTAQSVRRALTEAPRWQALPGWHAVKLLPATPPEMSWEVDSRFPFVDFDGVWSIQPGPPLRGQVVSGDARGARLGWDVLDGPAPNTAVAVFSLYPRLETSGYVPRKFIQAEPLLEHGLSLGVAYVDALSLVRALQGKQ